MLAKACTCAVIGLEGALVEVEVDIGHGLPAFAIVGLPDTAVNEAKERVRAAIKNSGAIFPLRRITVNLAPADLRKAGPAYDLPIAIAILMASEQVAPLDATGAVGSAEGCLFLGELSLDGGLRHTHGILPMVTLARELGLRAVYVPATDAPEAALVEDVAVYPVEHLAQLMAHLRGDAPIVPYVPDPSLLAAADEASFAYDLADVRGQEHVKRALEVAAAGGHNMRMTGPPGSGKTLLARTVPSILPRLTLAEALEVTKLYSVSGMLASDEPLVRQRPFRAPHHTISHAGLVGGGRFPRPGEISPAHRGVLFLDELPEFGQTVLEVLRQPLEDHVVTISRAQGTVTFPANFMLIGAMNPCPTSNHGDKGLFKQIDAFVTDAQSTWRPVQRDAELHNRCMRRAHAQSHRGQHLQHTLHVRLRHRPVPSLIPLLMRAGRSVAANAMCCGFLAHAVMRATCPGMRRILCWRGR